MYFKLFNFLLKVDVKYLSYLEFDLGSNPRLNTLSNMADNAASNFVHWGEGANEFGENLGTYMAFTGSIGTGITLATPGLEYMDLLPLQHLG